MGDPAPTLPGCYHSYPNPGGHRSYGKPLLPKWIGKTDCKSYLDIVDNKLLETIRHHMSGFLVAAIPNAWHQILPLEFSSHSVVNTLWFPPVWLLWEVRNYARRLTNKGRKKILKIIILIEKSPVEERLDEKSDYLIKEDLKMKRS